MQKFAALPEFVSTNGGGDFHLGARREPRFLAPGRLSVSDTGFVFVKLADAGNGN